MACFPCRGETVAVVRPARGGPPDAVQITPTDSHFGRLPISVGGYPSYCFGFARAPDPKVLKDSLAEVLSIWRIFAGRFSSDGASIVLNDAGAVYAVREVSQEVSGDKVAWCLSTLQEPAAVIQGSGALLTATLVRFASGAGVVCISRSHGVADGSTAVAFAADWAKVMAGHSLEPVNFDRSCYMFTGSLDEAIAETSKWYGEEVTQRGNGAHWAKNMAMRAFGKVEKLAIGCTGCPPFGLRPSVLFSHAELEHLKRKASSGLSKVPWITTQEALFAHLMLTIPKSLGKGPLIGLLVWLDGKRYLGAKRLCSGTCILMKAFKFNIAGKTLGAVAEELQLQMKALAVEDGASELKATQAIHKFNLSEPTAPWRRATFKDCDHVLMLNNQSKVPLIDFGTGPAEWAASTSGPTLMMPHRDGVMVYFDKMATLPLTRENRATVLAALHHIDGVAGDGVPAAAAVAGA